MTKHHRDDFTKRHMIIEAEKYIDSDRSDPFLRSRVYNHINRGIAGPGDYSAELGEGEYGRKVYSSVSRV
ncbi:MAG TPA: hypothetical protein VIY48_13550 [Candidatus Paceibacterota bacterium]